MTTPIDETILGPGPGESPMLVLEADTYVSQGHRSCMGCRARLGGYHAAWCGRLPNQEHDPEAVRRATEPHPVTTNRGPGPTVQYDRRFIDSAIVLVMRLRREELQELRRFIDARLGDQ